MRANDSPSTTGTPAPLMPSGACSRDDPQPKLRPATRISPFLTCLANSGRAPSSTTLPSSSAVIIVRYLPGVIWSVSTLSPKTHDLPEKRVSMVLRTCALLFHFERLAHLREHEPLGRELLLVPPVPQDARRLVDRLVGQPERPPMDR